MAIVVTGQEPWYGVHVPDFERFSGREPGWRCFPTAVLALTLAAGCRQAPDAEMTGLTEARRLAADLRLQFNKAADDANRAVMADTDEASVAFAREADQLKGLVRSDIRALMPHLEKLRYAAEIGALQEFERHFAEYEQLDRSILELAVENTNLKAQRLSFGPAREAADSLRDSLDALAASTPAKDRCRVDALVAKAVLAVREIQVLQAPHIAESEDAAMSRLEKQMDALAATAKDAVDALSKLKAADPKAEPALTGATGALARFRDISGDLVKLSRRNSNVRSLALSLRQKPALVAACDHSLGVLVDTLEKESFTAPR